ncbi:hypothetical protein PEB0150_003260 [Bartonella apis]|nr:hypothetical protein PEB0150_003260 [Bartonella apis]
MTFPDSHEIKDKKIYYLYSFIGIVGNANEINASLGWFWGVNFIKMAARFPAHNCFFWLI